MTESSPNPIKAISRDLITEWIETLIEQTQTIDAAINNSNVEIEKHKSGVEVLTDRHKKLRDITEYVIANRDEIDKITWDIINNQVKQGGYESVAYMYSCSTCGTLEFRTLTDKMKLHEKAQSHKMATGHKPKVDKLFKEKIIPTATPA